MPKPQGFRELTIGDVAESIKDGTHASFPRVSKGRPLLSAKNIGESGEVICSASESMVSEADFQAIRSTQRVERGDVLLTIVGSIGRVAEVKSDVELAFQRSVAAIRPRRGAINSAYLAHALRLSRTQRSLLRRSNSTAQAGVYLGELARIAIPVPPLAEQQRITKILDSVDESIHAAESLLEKRIAIKVALINAVFTRGLDERRKIRQPRAATPEQYRPFGLNFIPHDWSVHLLDEITERGSGHTPARDVSSYWNGGIKWVSLADSAKLDRIYIRATNKEISSLGLANSSAVLHPTHTVILSRDAGVGKSAILAEEMAVSQHFMAWRCGRLLDPHYLYYWLQFNKPTFESIAFGSTIKTIGLGFFKRLKIAIPDIDKQRLVVQVLLEAEAQLATADSELRKLRKLRHGLMEYLLTGRVRVKVEEDQAA